MIDSQDMMLKEKILDLPIDQQVKYANDHLGDLGRFYEKYKNLPAFRQFISEVRSKKARANLDETVTLPEILTFIEQNKKLFRNEDVEKLKGVEESFDGLLPDEELIPQLYFPSFDDLDTKDHNTLARGFGDETVYVYSTDPDEPDAPPAYKLDDNDNYVLYDDQLTEQEASRISNLVVLGFNEDANTPTLPPIDTIEPAQSGSYVINTKLKFDGASFTNPRENWPKGTSDIHITGLGYFLNPDITSEDIYVTNRKDNGELKPKGSLLAIIRRKHMKNGDYIHFNKTLINNFIHGDILPVSLDNLIGRCSNGDKFINEGWYLGYSPYSPESLDFADFVLFEYDVWPAPRRYFPLYNFWPGRPNTISNQLRYEKLANDQYVYRSTDRAFAFYRVYNVYWAHYNDLRTCNGTYAYFLDNTDEDVATPFYWEDMDDLDHKTTYTSN